MGRRDRVRCCRRRLHDVEQRCGRRGVELGELHGDAKHERRDPSTTPCSKNPCGPDELCAVCHYALSDGHQCHEKEVPGASSFACDWLACASDEACVHVAPDGDACFEAACEPLPSACAANPTCDCVETALEMISPNGFYDYDVTSCAIDGGHASVSAVVAP